MRELRCLNVTKIYRFDVVVLVVVAFGAFLIELILWSASDLQKYCSSCSHYFAHWGTIC